MSSLLNTLETNINPDIQLENSLLMAFIIDDYFCKEIVPITKVEYFSGIYSQIVLKWVLRYYQKWKKAPKFHIQDIFNSEKENLSDSIVENIELFLQDLSDRYSSKFSKEKFNSEYFIEKAKFYFKKQGLTNIIIRVANYLENGRLDEAEIELTKSKKIITETSTRWKYPFLDTDFIDRVVNPELSYLYQFEGKLGELVGPLKRGWLIGFMGPRKRGKSFFLDELAILTAMSGLKTLFISLEMGDEEVSSRYIQRIMAGSIEDRSSKKKIPVFDCLRNQKGTCSLPYRTNRKKLFTSDEMIIPKSKELEGYFPCTACRDKNDNYQASVWYEEQEVRRVYTSSVIKKVEALNQCFGLGKNLVLIAYPAYSASLSDISMDLQRLEDYEGFVPDVIIIDYSDILKPEGKSIKDRDTTDVIWMEMKSMAASRKCLVATATQSNRKSSETRNVKSTDVSEDIRKMNHVDIMLSINQLESEKLLDFVRIGVSAHRHRKFVETKHVIVLQQLEIGQVLLDSEWYCDELINLQLES